MNWKHGNRAGYTEFRYGQKKKPTLPAVSILGAHRAKPQHVLSRGKRENLAEALLGEFRQWRRSPFESEGALLAGLRAPLCLEGASWHIADGDVRLVLERLFQKMGAERPTWNEGQPSYTTPIECCQWCGNDIDMSETRSLRHVRFCSEVCANSAMRKREYETKWWEDEVGRAAWRLLYRNRQEHRACDHCGGSFKLERPGSTARYCSRRCHDDARRTVHERKCLGCGTCFTPPNRVNARQFCSRECYKAHPRAADIQVACVECGVTFLAKKETAKYCGITCNQVALSRRKALAKRSTKPLPVLTVAVFDRLFCHAA